MFEAAVARFVRSVGESSLLPVPNLDLAAHCRPLHVVVMKNKRWFWQKPKYDVCPMELHDILTQPEPVQLKTSTRKLCTYDMTHSFSIHGKTGAKLIHCISADVEGSDVVKLNVPIGDVNKTEVDLPDLIDKLDKHVIDFDSELVQETIKNPRKVLSVVTGVAYAVAEFKLDTSSTIEGKEELDVDIANKVITSGDEGGSINNTTSKSITVPAGTPLAYSINELFVDTDGTFKLMVEAGAHGGFTNRDEVDGVMPEDDKLFNEAIEEGIHKLSEQQRKLLAEHVQKLCTQSEDVQTMLALVTEASNHLTEIEAAGDKDTAEKPTSENVAGKFKCEQEHWGFILNLCGFQIKDGQAEFPKERSASLTAILYLFESLDEMDDEVLMKLAEVNPTYAGPLLFVINQTLTGKTVTVSDKELSPLYDEPNSAQAFLESLGFQVNKESQVLPSHGDDNELEGAYRAIHALWWKDSKTHSGRRKGGRLHKPRCTLV